MSEDKSEALLCTYRVLVKPATSPICVRMQGLEPDATYADEEGNTYNGAALMYKGMWIRLRGDFSSKITHLKKI